MKCGRKKPLESPPKSRLQRRRNRENTINCILGANEQFIGCLTTFSLFLFSSLACNFMFLLVHLKGLIDVHFVILIKVGASYKFHVYKAIGKCEKPKLENRNRCFMI